MAHSLSGGSTIRMKSHSLPEVREWHANTLLKLTIDSSRASGVRLGKKPTLNGSLSGPRYGRERGRARKQTAVSAYRRTKRNTPCLPQKCETYASTFSNFLQMRWGCLKSSNFAE